MYQHLLVTHSLLRWVALAAFLVAIYRAYTGYFDQRQFTKTDNAIRHWTATIAHIQLVVGMTLYLKSPVAQLFWKNKENILTTFDNIFFGFWHFLLMFISVVLVTIGSAMAKRKETNQEKFLTMLIWFSVALLIIFIAIPWPFSPVANRPYLRNF